MQNFHQITTPRWASHIAHIAKKHIHVYQLHACIQACQLQNIYTYIDSTHTTDGGDETSNHYFKSLLQIITTAKISNKFSRESPKIQTGFHLSKQSPRHLKKFQGKLEKSGDPNI